jgi:hypothetical protein
VVIRARRTVLTDFDVGNTLEMSGSRITMRRSSRLRRALSSSHSKCNPMNSASMTAPPVFASTRRLDCRLHTDYHHATRASTQYSTNLTVGIQYGTQGWRETIRNSEPHSHV